MCRLEKEKNHQKGELEELRGQVEHLTKAKVNSANLTINHIITVIIFIITT